MPLKTKKIIVPRRNYQRQIRTYTVLTLLVAIVAGVYGYGQYQKLSVAQAALSNAESRLTQMKSFEIEIADQYNTLKKAFDIDFENVRNAVEGVLPSTESYTALTKVMDDFVLTLNRQSPSIFMSNLKFSHPRIDTENDYAVLPFTLTLSTSRPNLEKFLQFAENSGSLDDGTRLLDVRAITINFPGQATAVGSSQSELLNVSLTMNAYFQIPPDEQ